MSQFDMRNLIAENKKLKSERVVVTKQEAIEKLMRQLWLLGVADLSEQDAISMLKFMEKEFGVKVEE